MKRHYKLLLLTLLIIASMKNSLPAKTEYIILYSTDYMNSYYKAENIVSFQKGIREAETYIFKDKLFEENSFFKKSAGITYRLGKHILLEQLL